MPPFTGGFDLTCCWTTVRAQRPGRWTIGSAAAACEEAAAGPSLHPEFLDRVRQRFWHLPRWRWFTDEEVGRLCSSRGRGLFDLLREDLPAGLERIFSVREDLLMASLLARFANPRRCLILSSPVAEFFEPAWDIGSYIRLLERAEAVRAAQGDLPTVAAVGEALYQLNRDLLGLLERDGLHACPSCPNIPLVRDGIRDLLDRHGGSPRPGLELVPLELKRRFPMEFLEFAEGTAALRQDPATLFMGVSFGRVRAYWKVVRAARGSRDTGMLLLGPPGAGKEPLARAAHGACPERRGGVFHAVSGANLRGAMVESELLGHRRGAYTGATTDRPGAFRQAHRGTLFLDEVGDLPATVQAGLLRVLQEKAVRPMGSDQNPIPVDVRVVAATNTNFAEALAAGRFRRDLYDRLAQEVVEVPGLRRQDVNLPSMLETLLGRMAQQPGGLPYFFRGGAREMLLDREWPGNVRELIATLQRAAIRSRSGALDEAVVQDALDSNLPHLVPGSPPPFPQAAGPPPAAHPPRAPPAAAHPDGLPGDPPATLNPSPDTVRRWFLDHPVPRGDTGHLSRLTASFKRSVVLALAREGNHRRTLGEIARLVGASQGALTTFLGPEALERIEGRVYVRSDGYPLPG